MMDAVAAMQAKYTRMPFRLGGFSGIDCDGLKEAEPSFHQPVSTDSEHAGHTASF